MTDGAPVWRALSPEEADVVRAIVTRGGGEALLAQLDGALASNSTAWVIDVKVINGVDALDLPNGPFPARAYVPTANDYRGEVLIWLTDGQLSGLEYAWVSDEAPRRWPRPDELEVVPS